VRRLDAIFRPTCRPRASLREKREPLGPRSIPGSSARGPKTPRKRQGDRSDVRQEYVRLKEPDPARAFASGRAPALHALRVSHNACLMNHIPSVRHARRKRPLFVGPIEASFIQRRITLPELRVSVKEFQKKGSAAHDLTGLGSARSVR
jgi:hypothetical protein